MDIISGVKLRTRTTAQRLSNVKSLTKNLKENPADDETLEVWKERDYVEVLGTDVGGMLNKW